MRLLAAFKPLPAQSPGALNQQSAAKREHVSTHRKLWGQQWTRQKEATRGRHTPPHKVEDPKGPSAHQSPHQSNPKRTKNHKPRNTRPTKQNKDPKIQQKNPKKKQINPKHKNQTNLSSRSHPTPTPPVLRKPRYLGSKLRRPGQVKSRMQTT